MPRTPRIAIVGGGIGGLAAALALERRGAEVIVCEQASVLSEIGAGVNLTPNAVKAFRALGLERRHRRRSAAASEFQLIRSWQSGRYISRIRRGDFRQKFGAPNLTVHRADLLDVAAPARSRRPRSGSARAASAVESRRTRRGGALCRRQRDRGRYRGRRRRHPFGGARQPVRRRRAALHRLHLLARHGADRSACRATSTPPTAPCGWARTAMSCTTACIAASSSTSSPISTATPGPRNRGRTNATFRKSIDDLRQMASAISPALYPCSTRWYKWALYDRDPLPRWSKGRATLLGDSAHAMLPYLGQGAGMAIEDGCVLAAMVARQADDLGAALVAYERTAGAARDHGACSARASAPRRTTSPRPGRGSSAT